jgi:hypothetical protein
MLQSMLKKAWIPMVLLWLGPACSYELETQRNPAPRGTLGEEIHRIIQQDLDKLQPPKGQSFASHRLTFVRAIDQLMPDALLDGLQAFFVQTLGLYDDQSIQNVLRPLACTLRQELASDRTLLQAIWYLRQTEGYGDDQVLLPTLRRLLARDDSDELVAELASLWLDHDGLDQDFRPNEEDATFAQLLTDLSIWLSDRLPDPADPQNDWAVFRDWLLSEDPRLAEGPSSPQWLVRADQRGRAMIAMDPNTGRVPAPFVDRDSDGLADLDPWTGDYLDAADQAISIAPPFDSAGERLRLDGRLVYRYADLELTPLAALLAQVQPLIEDGILWDLPDTLPALLGPLSPLADEEGVFAGYDPDRSPAIALGHAALVLLDYDRLPQLIESLLTIAELHEAQLARLLDEGERVGAVLARYPNVSTRANNRMLDDLVPHLLTMARRNYILRLLDSFDNPGWYSLQTGLAEMIRYRSVVPPGWDYYDDYDTYNDYLTVRQLTDFGAPDGVYDNRSNLQRGVHLIHDTFGVRHAMDIAGWEPFAIEDMLAFYVDSTARLSHVDWYVTAAVLEFSSDNPPTEEVNRFMINDHSLLGNPLGLEGFELRKYNAEALMALEFTGALAGLRPLWSTLSATDRDLNPTGTQVLGGLMAATHPHYSCNLPFAASACAHLRDLEPMLLEVLDTTEVLDAVVDLMASLQGRQTPSGYFVLSEIDRFVGHLLEPDRSITRWDGATSVLGGDDVTPVFPISRLYLLLDAIRVIDDAVDAQPAAKDAFDRAADLLYDRFLLVEQFQGSWRFENRPAWYTVLDLLAFLHERSLVWRDEGRLSSRLAELEVDVRDAISGRVLPRVIDAWELVAYHPTLPARFDGLALDLLEHDDPQNAREARRLAAWSMHHLQVDAVTVPIGLTLGRQLHPDSAGWRFEPQVGCVSIDSAYEPKINLRWLSRALALVLHLDGILGEGREILAELLHNGVALYAGVEGYAIDDLLEIMGAVHRVDPLLAQEYDVEDLGNMLEQMGEYLLDDTRGVEKLYVMVDRRDGF